MITEIAILTAKYSVVVTTIIALIYAFCETSSRKAVLLQGIANVLLAFLFGYLAAHLYYDARPFVTGAFTPLVPHAPDNGFPSRHTLYAAAIAAAATPRGRYFSLILWSIAIATGWARVYVGLHHLVDIIGSIIISIATAMIYVVVRERIGSTDQHSV
jgi:undecaprenyl-diphosphatase